MTTDPYVYDNGTLRNRFEITDAAALAGSWRPSFCALESPVGSAHLYPVRTSVAG